MNQHKVRDREQALRVVRQHLDDIGRTGTLEFRSERGRTPSYCVRFRYKCPETGVFRQHRLTIGDDPEIHEIVRSAIMARIRQGLLAKAAKAAAVKQRKQARMEESEFMSGYLGSRCDRRLARRAYRQSLATGKPFLIAMVNILSARPPRNRPGRPLKSRLW